MHLCCGAQPVALLRTAMAVANREVRLRTMVERGESDPRHRDSVTFLRSRRKDLKPFCVTCYGVSGFTMIYQNLPEFSLQMFSHYSRQPLLLFGKVLMWELLKQVAV